MIGPSARWPFLPPDFAANLSRRAEELYGTSDAVPDDEGLIELAVLPLRDVVLFPNLVTPLYVSTQESLSAVEHAIRAGETMIAVAQLDPELQGTNPSELYSVGTEIAAGRLLHMPDGSISVLTQGRRRVQIEEYIRGEDCLRARGRVVVESAERSPETLAFMRVVLTLLERCINLNRSLPEELHVYAVNIEEPGWLADLIGSSLSIALHERQSILETFDPLERLQRISVLLGRELDVLELEDQIHSQVQNEVDKSQREAYLREQMRAIQAELGEGDRWSIELKELRKSIDEMGLPVEVEASALKEVDRLTQMPPLSPETGIIRTYIEWIKDLPWTEATEDNLDVKRAKRMLNRNHHGLRQAKERILEYVAIRNLAPDKKRQPILCFVGPPGTGKTSLGQSIAAALGRKFVRISLGGVRDEAEIRGHRRTYIGALPGRILQTMRRAGTVNPLFMLDEVDKIGSDFRGDPSAALLEVLDLEQNHAFSDHYLEVPYDLSRVMFITTANTTDPIPPALLDRMEVIEFRGYIEEEKMLIARRFLIPRQMAENALGKHEVEITDGALQAIIRSYTWEAGVRNLEREIGKITRKLARRKAEGRKPITRVTPSVVKRLLGPPQITPRKAETEDQVGAATVLAWTEGGGDTMAAEVLLVEGKGGLQITGHVGEVMQESAQAALTYIKSRAKDLGVDPDLFEKIDVHIHIPEGAIPKDGPSAGITMATALASALTGRAVRRDVGLTGEITLRGRVLPVGGVREKVLAAYRLKLTTVVLPKENKHDLARLPKKASQALEIRLVDHMDEVLEIALLPKVKKKRPGAQRAKPSSTSLQRPHATG